MRLTSLRLIAFAATLCSLATISTRAVAEDDIAAAREHYKAGTRAYDLGQYQEAVREYEAAYKLRDDPAILFNIGQANRLAGDNASALRSYLSFLRRVPRAPNRDEVEEKIAELQKLIDQQARAKEGPPDGTIPPGGQAPLPPKPVVNEPASDAESKPIVAPRPDLLVVQRQAHSQRTKRMAGIGLMAGGGIALALGGAFVGLAKNANDGAGANDVYHPSAITNRDTFQALDVVCFAVGGVAVVGGAVLYALGRRHPSSFAIMPVVGPGHAGAAFQAEF